LMHHRLPACRANCQRSQPPKRRREYVRHLTSSSRRVINPPVDSTSSPSLVVVPPQHVQERRWRYAIFHVTLTSTTRTKGGSIPSSELHPFIFFQCLPCECAAGEHFEQSTIRAGMPAGASLNRHDPRAHTPPPPAHLARLVSN
jgi:hypothetical protein